MKRVVLNIERLVLRGFGGDDREAIAEGLRQELSRLLADPRAVGKLTSGGDVARLRLGPVSVEQGAGSQQVGAGVAQRIVQGMVR